MGWLYSSVGKSSSSVSSEKTAGYNSSLQRIDLHNCLIYIVSPFVSISCLLCFSLNEKIITCKNLDKKAS